MKEISKRKTVKMYECDICKAQSLSKITIISCEKRHKCKHSNFIYDFEKANEDAWWFNVKGIIKSCKDCGKDVGGVDFENIEDDQDILALIYDLCLEKDNE